MANPRKDDPRTDVQRIDHEHLFAIATVFVRAIEEKRFDSLVTPAKADREAMLRFLVDIGRAMPPDPSDAYILARYYGARKDGAGVVPVDSVAAAVQTGVPSPEEAISSSRASGARQKLRGLVLHQAHKNISDKIKLHGGIGLPSEGDVEQEVERLIALLPASASRQDAPPSRADMTDVHPFYRRDSQGPRLTKATPPRFIEPAGKDKP